LLRYRSINQILFAIFLLIVGMLLLLVNIGVISLEIKDFFVVSYPFLILAFGISLLIKRLVSNREGSLFFSTFLILFSSLLILDRFEMISFKFLDIWKLWPVLFIIIALSLIFKKNSVKIHFSGSLPPDVIDKKLLDNHDSDDQGFYKERKKVRGLSIGDVSFKESNWSLEPMELYNSIGDYYVDFSKAFIPEKETPITVQGWIGDVKMIVPENIPVHIEADINIGDIRIFEHKTDSVNHRTLEFKSPGYDEATRKLKIKIKLKIGSIRIDKV
jgi:lia operon protein LiaF